ncbi:MAG TPA: CoA transferase, partial [Acidimicrobiales bacterium]|nr:CoA transferase [Acidimicrobiales bacterium]
HHATIAPYGAYRTSDGELVLLAVQTAAEWKRFCAIVLERDDLADDPLYLTNEARLANQTTLNETLEASVGAITSVELIERLDSANLASARFNGVQGLVDHPQLAARGRWREVESQVGLIRCLLPPINLGSHDPVMGPIPALGEHTDAVLRDFGLSSENIAALRQSGAI